MTGRSPLLPEPVGKALPARHGSPGHGARKPKRHTRTQHRRVGHRSIGGRPGRTRIRGLYMRRRALHLGVSATSQTRVFDIGVHLVDLGVVVHGTQIRDGGPQLRAADTREFNQDGAVSPPLPARIQYTGQHSANSLAQASFRKHCTKAPKVPHRLIGMSRRIDSQAVLLRLRGLDVRTPRSARPDTRWAA